jgi:uncharacterized protein (TIGR00255 family)
MIKSMTGFGKSTAQYNSKKITVEIRSLNSKQADINARIPANYKEKEIEIRNLLTQKLERGKIDLFIAYETVSSENVTGINIDLAVSYHADLKKLATEIGEENSSFLGHLLRMPDVIGVQKEEYTEEEGKTVMAAFSEAINQLEKFRLQEGAVLQKELLSRIENILLLLTKIDDIDANRVSRIRDKIKNNLYEFLSDVTKIDQNRMEQEMIYYIEKLDITEEKIRLKAHCNYFIEIMNELVSNGRKLGFITQEIGREINTIGSKANDADIQKMVVQMKDELEKIKEQLNNVL